MLHAVVKALCRSMAMALLVLQCQAWTAPSVKSVDREIDEAMRLKDRGQTSQAETLLESLLPSLESGPPSVELGRVLNSLSQVSSTQGLYDKSAIFARKAQMIFHGLGDRASEAMAFNNAGVAELFKGDYDAASQDFTAFLELSRQIEDREATVKARNNLGSVYLYQSRYQDALVSYQAADDTLSKSVAEPWHAYWAKITLFNLATLYQRVGSLQQALETYKQLEQSPEGLSAGDRAHLYGNLGTIYRRLGDPWKAITSYRHATDLYARDRDSDGELGVLKNIGIVEALELGRLPDALRTFTAVLATAEKSGNKREVLQAHLYRGEALLRMNRIPDAAREGPRRHDPPPQPAPAGQNTRT
jgi:tetratricopeptide (TPR) repeat protein